jgi:hypothetical protein
MAIAGAGLDLSDRRHVRALYLDLLGRTPTLDEIETAAGSEPEMLVRHLCRGLEFWAHWYEDELYYFLLIDNARPEDEGEAGLPVRLMKGELSLLDGVRMIVSGSAFNRANPGNDTFVTVVFEQLLGLDVQRNKALLEAGKKMYDGGTSKLFGEQARGQSGVVRVVTNQDGFSELIAKRQYERLVGVPAPRELPGAWGKRLRDEPDAYLELVREWVLSDAYAGRLASLRPKTDNQFIRGLWVDLTGKRPDPVELQRLRGALSVLADAGPLRSVIARALLDSEDDRFPDRGEVEGETLIKDTFLRYLGRSPSPEELQDFSIIYAQEDTEPVTIVRSIVTHWEYQYY